MSYLRYLYLFAHTCSGAQHILCCVFVLFCVPYKAKKKICVFTVTRPTLIFASDPMHFYTEFG